MYSRPVRITNESIEKNIQIQRNLDNQRRDLSAFAKENANLINAANAQSRIEMQRRLAHQQACQKEQIFEKNLKQKDYEQKLKELTISQNQALATELDKDTSDAERRRREIQKICEESPELRNLEKMLKIAYLNKERAAQYEEKILLATKEQERIQAIEDQMEYERVNALRNESDKDKAKKAMYENQKAVLQKQIEEKKEKLKEAQRQMEQERSQVEEIIRKINEEDEQDYRKKKEKQFLTAQMVKNFEIQRQQELERKREEERREEERIRQYNLAVDKRSEGIEAKKQAKKEEDDRILKQIIEESERKRKEEEEFNNLRDLLWEEELEAKRSQEAYDRKMRQDEMRRDMMKANAEMMKHKEILRQKEMEKEAKLVMMMKQKFAQDEEKEREEEEKRRRAKEYHMSLIEKQKIDKKNMYERERAQEKEFQQDAQRREEYRQKVIKEARKRLLEEHAAKLAGFIPNKAFDDEDELAIYKKHIDE